LPARTPCLQPQISPRFEGSTQSLVQELNQARQSGADSLIGWAVGPEQGVLSAGREAIGWRVPQFGPWGLSNRPAFEVSNGAVECAMRVRTVLPNPFMERNSSFLGGHAKRSKEVMIGSAMSASRSYEATHLLLRAMVETRGTMTGPALREALENLPRPCQGVARPAIARSARRSATRSRATCSGSALA
jgi:branched-chain amino acid transport system substrate-binding protein